MDYNQLDNNAFRRLQLCQCNGSLEKNVFFLLEFFKIVATTSPLPTLGLLLVIQKIASE